ncbi:hypothetical protein KEM54_002173, partial [Ascosphaera aggregata]
TWLKQRGFGSALSCGGFGNFEWAALTALFMEGGGLNGKPLLSPSYSSYQIFKTMVQFLASRDLTKPLQISSPEKVSLPSSNLPVLFDGKRGLNILHKMSPWSYISLRHEARLTQRMLNDVRNDHFTDIFITKVEDNLCKYDQLLTVKVPLGLSSSLSALNYQRQIFEVLSKALGDRATLLQLKVGTNESWSTYSKAPGALPADSSIVIALLLNQHNVARLVDHGPSPEDKEEADAFRQFWGDKSELRRFKDGSIMESLLWSDEDSTCSTIQQIASHILNRHLKPKPRTMTFVSDSLGTELRKYIDYSEPLDTFKPVLDAFTDLERVIRELDELPLKLRHLAPCSPFLRYTSMNTSAKSDTATPVDITIEFEGSTRWPDDLAAIQMTKLAFLLKVSELLESSSSISSCRVGTENHGSTFLNSAFLDIVHCSLITFRLRIYHEREQLLLETQLKNKELSSQAREELARALILHKQCFLHTARHTLAFRTLCTRYPLLSPTIRIFKRWASAHLLSPYFHEELLELLVAHVFLETAPWGLPASAISGFFRTLHFVSRWDWQYAPVIVNLNAELDDTALGEIKTKFEAWRNVDPAMNSVSLFVASNLDRDGVIWTQSAKPPKVVAGRLRMLAKAALNLAKRNELHLNVDGLLTSPLSDYDFILRLSSGMMSAKSTPVLYKNLGARVNVGENATAVDAIKLLITELQHLYGHTVLFFHDGHGGKVVGGLWNPSTTKDQSWSLKIGYSTVPKTSESKDLLSLNKSAILNEIAILGGDLIQKIEVNRV